MVVLTWNAMELDLDIVKVDSLKKHEHTLPAKIDQIKYLFKTWSSLKDPIIIDENHIILDGNHRALIFKELNYEYIAACRINYLAKEIQLRSWYRKVDNVHDLDRFCQVLSNNGFQLGKRLSISSLDLEHVEVPPENLALFMQGDKIQPIRCFKSISIFEKFQMINTLEEILRDEGYGIDYIPDQYLGDEDYLDSLSSSDLIVITPRINKEDVIRDVLAGKIYAPKSTRHVIPTRPLNIEVPIEWFQNKLPYENLKERFEKLMANKIARHFGPGQVLDGRYYEEDILVFYDKSS